MDIHWSYGHTGLAKLSDIIPVGFSAEAKEAFECRNCVVRKMTRRPFNNVSSSASKVLERIH